VLSHPTLGGEAVHRHQGGSGRGPHYGAIQVVVVGWGLVRWFWVPAWDAAQCLGSHRRLVCPAIHRVLVGGAHRGEDLEDPQILFLQAG